MAGSIVIIKLEDQRSIVTGNQINNGDFYELGEFTICYTALTKLVLTVKF